MARLMVRDLFIYRKRNWLALCGFAFLNIFFMNSWYSASGFAFSLLFVSGIALIMTAQTSFAYDDMYNGNTFLRALPASPSTIVLSRYGSCLLSAASGILLMITLTAIAKAASVWQPSLWRDTIIRFDALWLSLIIVPIICAVLLPILFKFGYMRSKYPLMLIYILFASSAPMLYSDSTSVQGSFLFLSSAPTVALYSILLLIALLTLYFSIKLSVFIFSRKEI